MSYDEGSGNVVLFGGLGSSLLNDTWALSYDGSEYIWQDLTAAAGTPPPARSEACMSYDEASGNVVLFGGSGGSLLDDTWALNFFLEVSPPENLSGFQKKNDFGCCYELFTLLKWNASSSDISGYYVYRNGVRIAVLGSTTFQFSDHNNEKGKRISYSVTAFDASGTESIPVSITIM
jgi:hypothetical protein